MVRAAKGVTITPRTGATAPAQAAKAEGRTYTVVRGDTLWAIAKKLLNDAQRWPEIAKLNNIDTPDLIHPGQELRLPAATEPAPKEQLSPEQIAARTQEGNDAEVAANFSKHGSVAEKPKHGTLSFLAAKDADLPAKSPKTEQTEAPKQAEQAEAPKQAEQARAPAQPKEATRTAAPKKPKAVSKPAAPEQTAQTAKTEEARQTEAAAAASAAKKPSQGTALELLKNVDAGELHADLAIDPELGEISKWVSVDAESASAKLDVHVTEGGRIDREKTKVSIEGVTAAGVVGVKGAYIDEDRRIRVAAGSGLMDYLAPDIDITEKVLGPGVKQVPETMTELTKVLDRRRKLARKELKEKPAGPPSPAEQRRSAALKRMVEGAEIKGRGISLRGDAHLGEAGQVRWGDKTSFDVDGTLNDLTVKGHGDVRSLQLAKGDTDLALRDGEVDFQARYRRVGGRTKVDVALDNVDATVERFHSEERKLTIENAEIRNGRVEVKTTRGKEGATVDALGIDADFDGTVIRDGTTAVAAGKLHLEDDGTTKKIDVALDRSELSGGPVKKASLEGATLEGQVAGSALSARATAQKGRVELEQTTIDFTGAELDVKAAELQALGSGTASGTLKGRASTVQLQHQGTTLEAEDVAFTAQAKEVRDGKLLADVELDVGHAKGELPATLLRSAGAEGGAIDAAGTVKIKGATIDPATRALSGKIDEVDLDVSAKIGTIEGTIDVAADKRSRALRDRAEVEVDSAHRKMTGTVKATAQQAVEDLSQVGGAMAAAKQLQDGKMRVTIPLNEETIEGKAYKLINVPDNTELTAEIVVENGKPNYAKSKITSNSQIEALGFVDVDLQLSKDGEVQVATAGGLVKKSLYALPKDLDTLVSTVNAADVKKRQGAAGDKKASINETLDKVNQFAEVGRVSIEAEGTFRPGPLELGGGNAIELGPDNHVKVSGTSRALAVNGTARAGASIHVGGTKVVLDEGEVDFDMAVKTGLSEAGRYEEPSQVRAKIDVKSAHIRELTTTQGDNTLTIEHAHTARSTIEVDTTFQLGEGKADSNVKVDIPAFEGTLRNTRLVVPNADGSTATLSVDDAAATGSLHLDGDGLNARVEVQRIAGRVEDLDLDLAHAQIADLDGSISGSGVLELKSQKGGATDVRFEGDLQTQARIQDATMRLDRVQVDVAEDASASVQLRRFDSARGQVEGSATIEGTLDHAAFSQQGKPPIEIEKGSRLALTTEFEGQKSRTTGTIQAKLSMQDVDAGRLQADQLSGQATLDLGTITTELVENPRTKAHEVRYRIEGAEIKRLQGKARGVTAR